MSASPCCLQGFKWDGTPTGRTEKLGPIDVYVAEPSPLSSTTTTSSSSSSGAGPAVMIIHDLLGWTFPNARLLADHYAREAGVSVYIPDFFSGDVIDIAAVLADRWQDIDMSSFLAKHSRANVEPKVVEAAKLLRENHGKLAAAGFCYGGWAAVRLAGEQYASSPLVDCILIAHPSLLTKEDIDGLSRTVPVQVLAPQLDPVFTAELKTYLFETLQAKDVAFDYVHFPGVRHACMTRGDPNKAGERAAMEKGKNAAVWWFRQHLHGGA